MKNKNIPASPPTLSLEYNFSSEVEGSSELNIEPIPHPDDVKFIDEQTGLVFHYKIVSKDSAKMMEFKVALMLMTVQELQ